MMNSNMMTMPSMNYVWAYLFSIYLVKSLFTLSDAIHNKYNLDFELLNIWLIFVQSSLNLDNSYWYQSKVLIFSEGL